MTTDDTPAVSLEGVRKMYPGGGSPALDGLSLSVAPGEFVGLLGPNGAGKTTTLSILSGVLAPTDGIVRLFGLDQRSALPRIKPLVGFVPQDLALYEALTARENLAFFGRLYGLGGRELWERLDEALTLVGLTERASTAVATYSGGMKRRLNLVLALLHRPRLILLDEPTVGIDTQSRQLIFECLRGLNRAGAAIIYATHYMEEAESLCSRVVIIDHGRVLREGSPRALIEAESGCRDLQDLFLRITGRSLRE